MSMPPLRVGVIGVGHLGSRHAHIYASMPGVRLVTLCDIEAKRAEWDEYRTQVSDWEVERYLEQF